MEKTIYTQPLRNLLGEFMSDEDIAQLERYLQEEGALRAKKLMDGLSVNQRRNLNRCQRPILNSFRGGESGVACNGRSRSPSR